MNTQRIFSILLIIPLGLACSKRAQSLEPIVKAEVQTSPVTIYGGITLSADGPGETYELINKYFGGKGNVVEAPDCSHTSFGKHISEVYDNDLKKHVFAFQIHLTPDNDKCEDSDRQRNEIKTYDQSPANLLASKGETVRYQWKFKLDKDFKPTSDFTHIHQIKPTDGDNTLPIITLTPRYKSTGDLLQVIHTGDNDASSEKYLSSIPLADFRGQWVEVSETATFATKGKYEIFITRISDGKILLKQAFVDLDMWRTNTTTCRPKWGIYRRTLQPLAMRDETVWFNDFMIKEITN